MIREARFEAGLTQAELADRSGTSQAAISAYERASKVPSATTLQRLLAACGRRLAVEVEGEEAATTSAQRGRALWDLLLLADAIGRPPLVSRPRFPVLKTE